MWLVLSFIVCLHGGSGDRCRKVQLPWNGTPLQCMLFGQEQAARWIAEHPGYQLQGAYRCVNGEPI